MIPSIGFLTLSLLTQLAAPPVPLLVQDSSAGRIAIVQPDGSLSWERSIGPAHDLQVLGNGHVLMQDSWTHLIEVDPSTDTVVWEYDATRAVDAGQAVEVHAFQRLPSGRTMIALSGPSEIIEFEPDGTVAVRVPLQVDHPSPHHDTRLVRKTAAGTYLVAHESDGTIREYDVDGAVVWDYPVPLFGRERAGGHGPEAYGNQAFGVVRLPSGNTLLTTGNGHGAIEVTPDREIVWQLRQDDLDGIRLAWTTSIEPLPDGGLLLTNCHAGPEQPQVVAIDRDKTVRWQFRDFKRFGNATTNAAVYRFGGPK